MTPNELLKIWLGNADIAPEKILKATGLQVPVTWGRQQAFVNFSKPTSNIIFAIQLQYDNETAFLGLSKSAECNDLPLLAANLDVSPKELLLAVFEAGTQYTLNALSQPIGKTPKIIDIAPLDGDIWNNALPFTLATVEKQALIANGLIALSPSLADKFADINYLAPNDASIMPQAPQTATAFVTHFPLEQNASLEVGDYLMLPEINMEQYPWSVTLVLENGITLSAELIDSQTLQLQNILDSNPIPPDEFAISIGTTSIQYPDLLAMMSGETVKLPLGISSQVQKNGQMIARGHITSFYNSTAFEIEA